MVLYGIHPLLLRPQKGSKCPEDAHLEVHTPMRWSLKPSSAARLFTAGLRPASLRATPRAAKPSVWTSATALVASSGRQSSTDTTIAGNSHSGCNAESPWMAAILSRSFSSISWAHQGVRHTFTVEDVCHASMRGVCADCKVS